MESILVVEDDPSIARGLKQNLVFEGYSVEVVADGELGLRFAVDEQPDLVLLDVMLPRMNGFEVLRELRRLEVDVPVILLTAKGEEVDKVRGLDLGADDYVVKPFGLAELLARIRTVLRRRQQGERRVERTQFGEAEVDLAGRLVTVRGQPVELTSREFDLLRLFLLREGEALAREEIIRRVWGYDYQGTDRTLDNFVSRLRQKLEPDPANPRHFLTVRGVGYRFWREGRATPDDLLVTGG
ncbi:MAG: response regulator transcription factor [Deltaproteobacteria bacterium]|nr:response regulator transcription factor [Deltaproteobacteria bacterium]